MADALARLEWLLATEADLLARGDLAGVVALVAAKERLIDAVLTGPVPGEAALARMRARAGSNMSRLSGALRGLRSARRTMQRIAGADATLSTYDRLGASHPTATPEGTLKRRV